MKNATIIKTALAALSLCALFAGCSAVGASPAADGSSYTVSGKILIGATSGATSSAVFRTADSTGSAVTAQSEAVSLSQYRTATSTFATEYGNVQNELSVGAYQNDTIQVSCTVSSDGSYSLALPSGGTWYLRASKWMFVDDNSGCLPSFDGSVTIEVSDEPLQQDIIVYPMYFESISGAVSLTLTDGTENKIIKSVSCIAEYRSDNPISEDSLSGTVSFTNGTAAISQTAVPAGRYDVTFLFSDEAGNTLYSCREWINVFSGWTTDTWFGTSPHMQEADGSYSFVITDELIESYGTELVQETPYALYTAGSEGYSYSLADSPTDSAPASFTTPINSVVVDNDGNAYYLQGNTGDGYTIASSKSGFSYDAEAINYTDSGCGLMFDRANNVLYAYSINEATLTIFEYTSAISSGVIDSTSTVTYTSNIDIPTDDAPLTFYHGQCIVHDGIVYDLGYIYGQSGNYLAELILAGASEGSVGSSNIVSVALPSDSCSVTDMLYQDGAVYMLVRQVSANGSNSTSLAYYSWGALLRYDIRFGSVQTVIPLSDSVKNDSDFASVKVGLYYQGDYPFVTSSGETTPLLVPSTYSWTYGSTTYTVSDCIPALYTPNPLETDSETHEPVLSSTAFYGPVKFVAVKPRKLVIADDGLAFYTDADGVLKYKNVNRVVTVDLETFAIVDETESSAKFAADTSSVKSFICGSQATNFQSAFSSLFENSTRYYYNGNNWEDCGFASYAWAGIPCGD